MISSHPHEIVNVQALAHDGIELVKELVRSFNPAISP